MSKTPGYRWWARVLSSNIGYFEGVRAKECLLLGKVTFAEARGWRRAHQSDSRWRSCHFECGGQSMTIRGDWLPERVGRHFTGKRRHWQSLARVPGCWRPLGPNLMSTETRLPRLASMTIRGESSSGLNGFAVAVMTAVSTPMMFVPSLERASNDSRPARVGEAQ